MEYILKQKITSIVNSNYSQNRIINDLTILFKKEMSATLSNIQRQMHRSSTDYSRMNNVLVSIQGELNKID